MAGRFLTRGIATEIPVMPHGFNLLDAARSITTGGQITAS